MATQDNLADAFAGESQANRKYLAFATKADKDGFPNVAKLFRAAAAAETVHAHAHLRAMKGVKDTVDNIQAGIDGEGFEFQTMYPPYIEEAKAEGNKAAEITFKNAMVVEEVHYNMYKEALDAVKGGGDLPDRKVYICEICGNTVYGAAEDKCSVCNAPGAKFVEVS